MPRSGWIALSLFALIVGGIVCTAWLRPADYAISRSTTINAPPASVFPQINELRRWQTWSPWATRDRNIKVVYGGPDSGEGAAMRWDGNANVGAGSMIVLESRAPEHVKLRVDVTRPIAGTSASEFKLAPEGDATRVTWTISGTSGLTARLVGLFAGGMDAVLGPDMEKGLADLKAKSGG